MTTGRDCSLEATRSKALGIGLARLERASIRLEEKPAERAFVALCGGIRSLWAPILLKMTVSVVWGDPLIDRYYQVVCMVADCARSFTAEKSRAWLKDLERRRDLLQDFNTEGISAVRSSLLKTSWL